LGSPIKRHLSRENNTPHARKSGFFEERCGCENGPPNGSSEQSPPYRVSAPPIIVASRAHRTIRFVSYQGEWIARASTLSLCRSFFGFSVLALTAPVTHQDQDVQNCEPSPPLASLSASADPENLRFQAVSNSLFLTELMVVSANPGRERPK
jgi:hypothetical protein